MGRPIVLSNGQLFVGLNEDGLVHDFYYPYVGLENLTTARSSHHKIGVWVDNDFKWTDDGSWEISVEYRKETLISRIKLHSSELKISLLLQDYVDVDTNSFIRNISVINQADKDREIRLFMHQVFQISRDGRADTALYVPDEHYLLDYKGRYSLLIGGKFSDNQAFDQYAVGNYGIEDKAGTYLDAEDGNLSGNPVEHGGVDSVIRFCKTIAAGQTTTLDYWIIAANNQPDAQAVHIDFNASNMQERLNRVEQHWHDWLDECDPQVPDFNRQSLERSLLIIKAHCDERGSVLASGDSSIFNYGRDYYCYCWPRDAAYALWPLIRLGHFKEFKAFMEFARDTMHKDGYLMHKYQPDRAIGSTWHPLIHGRNKELAIQEDETAGVIFMMGEFLEASQDTVFVENMYENFISPAANFMCRYIDQSTGLPHASYDLWEEKFLTTTYTVCLVIGALETAARLATAVERPDDSVRWQQMAESIRNNLDTLYNQQDGCFVKGFLLQPDGTLHYDNTIDISSLYGPFMYARLPLNDQRLISTVKQVQKRIVNVTPSGGVLRYEGDNYFRTKHQYPGNPWAVGSLWLAQYYAAINNNDEAKQLLQWALDRQLASGTLSEQFDPETGAPLGVTPLVWSHSELVNTLLDLSGSEY